MVAVKKNSSIKVEKTIQTYRIRVITKKKILLFTPAYNMAVATKIGREFF